MVAVTADAVRVESRFFYVGMAAACVPTCWMRLAEGIDGRPIHHIHGASLAG